MGRRKRVGSGGRAAVAHGGVAQQRQDLEPRDRLLHPHEQPPKREGLRGRVVRGGGRAAALERFDAMLQIDPGVDELIRDDPGRFEDDEEEEEEGK